MLVLSLASVLVLVAALLASLSAVAVARQRAAGIADLAALAGAARALDGQAAACARAEQVALLGGGRLVECSLDGARVEVRAEVRPPGGLGALGAAAARASAGPVDGLATAAVTGVSRDRSPGLRTASCGPSPRRNLSRIPVVAGGDRSA